jgi:hypothetical protein
MSKRISKKAAARKRAARKAAETRAANRAMLKRWREVDEPSGRRMDALLNHLLSRGRTVSLRWNPLGDTGRKLKHGAEYGSLVKFMNGGRILRVLPEGYKQPMDFHPGYWEPIIP